MSQVEPPEAPPEDPPRRPHRPTPFGIPRWLLRAGLSAWLLIGFLIIAVALYFGLAAVSSLVAPLVVATVMGMLFYPLVDRLGAIGIRRGLGAALILLALAAIILVSLYVSVRGIFDQGPEIAQRLTQGWEALQDWLESIGFDPSRLQEALEELGSRASGIFGGIVTATFTSVGAFLIGLFIATFLLYYLLKDWHQLKRWLASHAGVPTDLGTGLIDDATTAIRAYFYALTISSIPIALVIGATMWLLDLPLAFTVTLVTFVTAYIPYLGAIFSGAFATLVALGSGGITDAVIVLVVVLLTQNGLQAVLLTRLSSTTLRIHPIVNLGSTIVGATLAGILGATLSAPFVAMVIAASRRLREYRWGEGPGVEEADSGERDPVRTD